MNIEKYLEKLEEYSVPARRTEKLIKVEEVHEEYVYIRKHYRNYEVIFQTVVKDPETNKCSDVIKIKSPKGRKIKYVYFDISSFLDVKLDDEVYDEFK